MFRFDSLPQGRWSLVGHGDALRRIASIGRLDVGGQQLVASGLRLDTAGLLLDDFADSNSIWALDGQFGNGGYWWVSSKAPLQDVFGVDGAWQSITGAVGQRRISVRADLGNMLQPWANVGLNFGSTTSVLPDFSKAKSVRVRLRGQGTWMARLAERKGEDLITWDRPLPVGSDWTEIVLPIETFVGPEASFSSRARWIRELVFQTQESGTLEISRVWVDGLALSDWGR
jgi:hypothetical protein